MSVPVKGAGGGLFWPYMKANLASLQQEGPTRSEILSYDEPDTHLDYASQRVLFDILSRQARLPHVQVFVATHSLNFIDKVGLESILHLRTNQALQTEIEILGGLDEEEEIRFLASVCAGLGLRNSVLLDERCFLLVEGETEEAAIPTLFRTLTGRGVTAAGLSLLNTKGSGAVHQLVDTLVHNGIEWW